MSRTKLAGFICCLVLLAACQTSKHDSLTGKKWVGSKIDLPKKYENAKYGGSADFKTEVYEYKPDSFCTREWKQIEIDWNNDSDLVAKKDSFQYYRKGNSLFTKGHFNEAFIEQHIKELTDSTLAIEVPGEGIVFHYTAMKQ